MEFKTLLEKVIQGLKASGREHSARLLAHCQNENELRSTLRNDIFKNDTDTADFVNGFREKETVLLKESLCEREMNEIIASGLESFFKKKDSKFKIVKKYFSPDGDFCIQIADKQGYESYYRIMTLRT